MDPLSITAAAVSFLNAGFRFKASIDKVNTNRRRLRELTDDLVVVLTSVKNFCTEHEVPLRGAPFAELSSSMDQVTRTLLQLCDQAERIAGVHNRMKVLRPGAAIAAWRDAGKIETQLIRLREKIQISLNQAQLLISARTEVSLTTLEQEVLVSRADDRAHIRQLDDLFCEALCAPDSKYSTVSFLHISELDNITLPYIRLKLRNIQRLWAERSRTITITPGTYSSMFKPYAMRTPTIYALPFTTVAKRLTEFWRNISMFNIGSVSSFDAIAVVEFVDDLHIYGLTDTTFFDVYNYFVHDLRRSIRESTSPQAADELRLWLSFALLRRCDTSLVTSNLPLLEEALEAFLALSPDAASVYGTPAQTLKLSHLLSVCASESIRCQDYDAAFSYAQKALDVLHPNYQLGDSNQMSVLSLARWTIQDASTAQSYATVLFYRALAHAKLGQYNYAYHTGVDALSFLRRMTKHAVILPSDFDYCDGFFGKLERDLPSWVGIVQNPSARASPPHDWSGRVSPALIQDADDDDYIEWGIVI